mmetsp:Transcript_80307/g.98343  ORF Transcript_80307/g.98343 Transcript_80307/m.98343 type:complete len:166 (-) Transcript_80307:67-564(-)
MSQCLQVQQSLRGEIPSNDEYGGSIVKPSRKFIKQFIFYKYKDPNIPNHFFIFNDILIIANNKWKIKYFLPLKFIEIKHDNGYGNKAFLIYSNKLKKEKIIYIDKNNDINVKLLTNIINENRLKIWDGDLSRASIGGSKMMRKQINRNGVTNSYKKRKSKTFNFM